MMSSCPDNLGGVIKMCIIPPFVAQIFPQAILRGSTYHEFGKTL